MSDYETYLLIEGAFKTADAHGLSVSWGSAGWTIQRYVKKAKTLLARGKTATELVHYLNGISDGKRIGGNKE